MSEKLERRIRLMEQKLNPRPKECFDIIKHVYDIRTEAERLMTLSQSDYEKEIEKPPHSMINRVARIGVADEKRFDCLSPQDQRRELGYPNIDAIEFAKIQQAQNLIKANANHWLISHLSKIRSRKP